MRWRNASAALGLGILAAIAANRATLLLMLLSEKYQET